MPLDRERLRELLEIFKESSVGEMAVQEGDRTYRFARVASAPAASAGAPADAAIIVGPEGTVEQAAAELEVVTITARVVGLFYRGDEPGGEALVQVGALVEEGQALGIIEVLRKPTEIVSPVAGAISEIFHHDGDGVQYGDPLFTVKPV